MPINIKVCQMMVICCIPHNLTHLELKHATNDSGNKLFCSELPLRAIVDTMHCKNKKVSHVTPLLILGLTEMFLGW